MSYQIQQVNLKSDYEGKVVATIISSRSSNSSGKAVLYIHGFIDYFFQDHLADAFTQNGMNFYALELRKYGRSLLPHQHPNYCKNIHEYFEEIDRSIEKIVAEGNLSVALIGHSTGGLVASLYCSKGRYASKVSGLILNSPFLEYNVSFAIRTATLVASAICSPFPFACVKGVLSPLYAQSVHKSHKGEWSFNLAWKPIEGFPSYFRWIIAIRNGHNQVKKGLKIACPILVMHSSSSLLPKKWTDEIMKSDIVLNVEHMKKYGKKLGANVEFYEVKDGMHDLVLSRKDVREKVLEKMVAWSKNVL